MNLYTITIEKRQLSISNNSLTANLPILKAFGINQAHFLSGVLNCMLGDEMKIDNGILTLYFPDDYEIDLSDGDFRTVENKSILNIYHTGIKDYSLLFPNIQAQNKDLAIRLGKYYYESENAYNNELWLSFILMCGGIFEGLLYHELNYPTYKAGKNKGESMTFYDMNKLAIEKNIILKNDYEIINKARKARNSIHANKYTFNYYSRKDAVEMKHILDKLIYKFSIKNSYILSRK
ncbi:hypothetical protein ABFP60_18490 [Clostridioides difficile]